MSIVVIMIKPNQCGSKQSQATQVLCILFFNPWRLFIEVRAQFEFGRLKLSGELGDVSIDTRSLNRMD